MIRALRLRDVLAYLSFRSRAGVNEALLKPDDAPCPPSFLKAFFGRSLESGHQSWMCMESAQIEGLVATRPRVGGDIWDIDQLFVVPTVEMSAVYRELLAHVTVAARDGGILKVFLRVEADSAPELAARRVGFHQYARDLVYRLSDMTSRPALTATTLHARRRVHHHAIFQLYSAVVPIEVREMEGMTLQEWRLADGWGFRPAGLRVHLSQRRRDFVLERDGKVVLWSCIDQQSRHVQLTAQGDEPADVVREALRHGLAQLPFGGAVTCAVRSYQPSLLPLLEGEGFVLRAEHALLGQSLTVRVPQRQFVPARA